MVLIIIIVGDLKQRKMSLPFLFQLLVEQKVVLELDSGYYERYHDDIKYWYKITRKRNQ